MNLLPRPRSIETRDGTAHQAPARHERRGDIEPQGYVLDVSEEGISIASSDPAGAHYGQTTLAQLVRLHGEQLPCCRITDWPDIPVRAVMLDIARDKVPTMETLRDLVDRLASWKVNELQLYMEHTFAYRDHEEVWRDASPITPEEAAELSAYCRERHMALVPNQNLFGHMDRWLRHERYRSLAMAPEGWTDPRGRKKAPTTLDPANPAALELVRGLLPELTAAFPAERIHVGMDEPWEMPHERFPEYLDWINRLRSLPDLDGREMLIWGDIVASHPESLESLAPGVTVCEWGYEDWHPFDDRLSALERAGVPAWVAPGTSSWLSLLGRWDNMRGDCAVAARAAIDHGSRGLLNTDWGDMGHLQYLPVSEPGLAYGAAVSWCLEANQDLELEAALDTHVFRDEARQLGGVLRDLGSVYRKVTPSFPNISVLVMHLYFPQLQLGRTLTDGLTVEEISGVEATLASCESALERARPAREDGSLVIDELGAAIALVSVLCRDARLRLEADGWLSSVPEEQRSLLASQLSPLIETHRSMWLARNRPGGLRDSSAWLEHLLRCYETGVTDKEWGGW